MMGVIKFSGRNKKESVKKAVNFYYDNYDYGIELFLAKCRVQLDGKTVYFYPNLDVDLKQFRKWKAERKRKGKK